jgi:hypothetical protein
MRMTFIRSWVKKYRKIKILRELITIEQYSTVLFYGGKNGENKGVVN